MLVEEQKTYLVFQALYWNLSLSNLATMFHLMNITQLSTRDRKTGSSLQATASMVHVADFLQEWWMHSHVPAASDSSNSQRAYKSKRSDMGKSSQDWSFKFANRIQEERIGGLFLFPRGKPACTNERNFFASLRLGRRLENQILGPKS